MSHRPVLRFASRGWRDLPSPSTRVRGSGELPYNPNRPLTLPGARPQHRRPQFRGDILLRVLLPLIILGGLGVGVFFGVSALLDSTDDAPATVATATPAAADATTTPPTAGTQAAPATPGDTAGTTAGDTTGETAPINSDQPTATAQAQAQPATTDAATDPAALPTSPDVITAAQLSGAPAVLDRGGATPIPSGVTGLTLADGTIYDPTDDTAALSSVWPAGTVLELTRLPGGPLLTDDDAAELIGKTIQIVIVGNGQFPTELQLSPAAYQRLARDFEPIIALRIVAVSAPE